MCYSKEVSRNSFIINVISCYILYNYHSNNKTHRIFALFFGFVGLMQLFDWIFWENQIMNKTNYITTKIAMISNHIQPIILGALMYYFNGNLSNNSWIILLVFSIVIMYYTIDIYNQIDYTLVTERSKPSLDWEWNSKKNAGFVYSVFLSTFIILSLENLVYPMNLLLGFISVVSFSLASYYYKGVNIGRFWCNGASYIPLIVLVCSNYLTKL